MSFVLAVCGLAIERRLADGPGVRSVAGGGRSDALAAAIEREVVAGAIAIISFGVAGALDPMRVPGSTIVATGVVDGDRTWATDAAWSDRLGRSLLDAQRGTIAGVDHIVAEPRDKTAMHVGTGALAVDMESHVAARIAQAHGLPLAILRTIADPVHRTLPPAARIAMRSDGAVDLPAVLRSLARRPAQLPALLRIGLDARRALRSLDDARGRLGRGLGYLDLDQLPVDVVREHVA